MKNRGRSTKKARPAGKLDSLEKELKRSAKKQRKIAKNKPAFIEQPRTHIDWRLSMLEGALSAEQRARAQPTLSTADSNAAGRTKAHERAAPHGSGGEDRLQVPNTSGAVQNTVVPYESMADRLATEIIRRQSLEERISQLEYIIKTIVAKGDSGAIDIVPDEVEADETGPIPVRAQPKRAAKDDFTPQKVRSGTPRLDDLLLGGIPFGSNVLLYGPPFAGKELLVNAFIAEGVKWGTPVLWLLTDRSPKEIRAEMTEVFPEYEDAEKLGLIRYIDAHSRAVGSDAQEPFTDYVDSPTDFEAIQRHVERISKEFKREHDYYRMAVRGLSTLIAYSDPRAVFRFLNSFVGKRKRDRAVTLYTIAKGVHTDHDIQMISSLMDGVIELKFENHDTFMAIRGICEVRSRAYVRYALSRTGMEIGSFSLDHIR